MKIALSFTFSSETHRTSPMTGAKQAATRNNLFVAIRCRGRDGDDHDNDFHSALNSGSLRMMVLAVQLARVDKLPAYCPRGIPHYG